MPGQSVRIAIDQIDCRFSFWFVIGRHFGVIAAVSVEVVAERVLAVAGTAS